MKETEDGDGACGKLLAFYLFEERPGFGAGGDAEDGGQGKAATLIEGKGRGPFAQLLVADH